MRRSKFSETRLVAMHEDAESGVRARTCCGSMG